MIPISRISQLCGFELHHYPTLRSTNQTALELLQNAEYMRPLLVVADAQTHGRGQHGRAWHSNQGSLTFSLATRFEQPLERLSALPSLIGAAVCDAIKEVTGELEPKLKWPNDVVVNETKVCGILVETKSISGIVDCVTGIGINVDDEGEELLQRVQSSRQRKLLMPSALQRWAQTKVSPSELMLQICWRAKRIFSNLESNSMVVTDGMFENLWRYEQEISVEKACGETLSGVHMGIAPDGALVLKTDGEIGRIYSGSIIA